MMKRFIKTKTTRGLRQSVRDLWLEVKFWRRHCAGLRRAGKYAAQKRLRLHVGCGTKLKEGWVNVDLIEEADLTLDLRERLPFADGCCSMIYSEHLLEHFDYPRDAEQFLRECHRVLEAGGVLSIVVPDTEWPILEYAGQRGEGYFRIAKEKWHPDWCQTEMEHINQHFREDGGHRFAYDFKTLAKVLTSAGFEAVCRRDFDPELDSADRRLGSLYVHASKPPSA